MSAQAQVHPQEGARTGARPGFPVVPAAALAARAPDACFERELQEFRDYWRTHVEERAG